MGCSHSSVKEVDKSYVVEHLNDATIVDVRTAEEFAEGHITHAVNIDAYGLYTSKGVITSEDAEKAFMKAGIGKEAPLIIYCRSGVRAMAVAEPLVEAGYTDVSVYTAGYPDWVEGAPLSACEASEALTLGEDK